MYAAVVVDGCLSLFDVYLPVGNVFATAVVADSADGNDDDDGGGGTEYCCD